MLKHNQRSLRDSDFIHFMVLCGYLSQAEMNKIIANVENDGDIEIKNMENRIIEMGILSTIELIEAKSFFLGIPRIILKNEEIDEKAVSLISEELARKYNVFPVRFKNDKLVVAMSDPTNLTALDNIRLYTGNKIEPLLGDVEEINIAIRQYLTVRKSLKEVSVEDYSSGIEIWQVEEKGLDYIQGTSVARLVDSIFRQALIEEASDIHWEPKENEFVVRFRLDGLLIIKAVFPSVMARSIASRLKVMAEMDVSEKRLPQDGRMVVEISGKRVDVRAATFPTVYGEKVVTRILDSETAMLSLEELGMSRDVEYKVRELIKRPYGLILVSGPTGSGKTTTLYALLREIQTDKLNIVSIEDPIEYRLNGVNQAQIHTKVGFDFANGLRAILRQDPDVIMVGEIRDKETARIAVAAALTGHLVFSTVHTNTSAEAVARLLDMEIESYLLASAVCGVLSQRLVRKLCSNCKVKYEIPDAIKKNIFKNSLVSEIYKPVGCSKCWGTGYKGRIGIHEYLLYNSEIKELVLKKKSAEIIQKTAKKFGMATIVEDLLLKVEQGVTSLEEFYRITAGL